MVEKVRRVKKGESFFGISRFSAKIRGSKTSNTNCHKLLQRRKHTVIFWQDRISGVVSVVLPTCFNCVLCSMHFGKKQMCFGNIPIVFWLGSLVLWLLAKFVLVALHLHIGLCNLCSIEVLILTKHVSFA